jgi:hypothetical protein
MDSATKGAMLMSFGSTLKSSVMKPEKVDTILQTFRGEFHNQADAKWIVIRGPLTYAMLCNVLWAANPWPVDRLARAGRS